MLNIRYGWQFSMEYIPNYLVARSKRRFLMQSREDSYPTRSVFKAHENHHTYVT